MIDAFAYLTARTAYNRIRGQLLRLKSPRYAIGLALGIAYFYFVYFRQSLREGRAASPFASPVVGVVVSILLFLYVAYTWIMGSDRMALAFSQAEVSMLLPAPVSRRGLIVYKLVRSQSAVLFTSIVWYLLFRRPGAGWERVVGTWVLFSTLSLHRLGAALVHASAREHGARGWRRNWLPILLFGVAVALIVRELLGFRATFLDTGDISDFVSALVATFSKAPVRWVLYPFTAVTAPLFATTMAEWLSAIGPALLVMLAHFAWVLASDTAFEEAAVEASAARAQLVERMQASGTGMASIGPKSVRRTLPLAAIGAPSVALVWKNLLWLLRTGQMRSLVTIPLGGAIAAVVFAGRSEAAEFLVAGACVSLAVMTLAFGPMTMRNDLRGELRRLPLLKSLPLRGREIVLAEVASSALPTALMQYLLVAVAVVASEYARPGLLATSMKLAILTGAPFFIAGLSLANFTLHNGLALLFPGWVRLGETGGARVEVMGQMMLTTILTFAMLAVMLVAPALVAGIAYFVLRLPPAAAVAISLVVAGTILAAETYVLMGTLGRSLDRLEPMQIG